MSKIKNSSKTFKNFEEAELDMRKSIPPVLYKYRDWSNKYHRTTLTVPEIYFSHPKSLNDPYDIRVPVQIDYGEVNSPEFYSKIEESLKYNHPELQVGSSDFKIACSNLFDLIKQDPQGWFERNIKAIRDSDLYDCIGVLSLTLDALSENMWAYYGNNNKGFCIGYDGVEIYKTHNCSCTYVQYKDEPTKHNLLNSNSVDDMFMEFFTKRKKWEHEQEYRFVTMFMTKEEDRKLTIPDKAIREVLLGTQTPKDHEDAIIKVLKEKYNSQVSLFKLQESITSYGFEKIKVDY